MAEYVTKEEMERYVEQMTQRYVSQKEIGAYTGMLSLIHISEPTRRS